MSLVELISISTLFTLAWAAVIVQKWSELTTVGSVYSLRDAFGLFVSTFLVGWTFLTVQVANVLSEYLIMFIFGNLCFIYFIFVFLMARQNNRQYMEKQNGDSSGVGTASKE